jgi:hypothetical protein
MGSAAPPAMFETGAICRSKDPIMKCADEEQGRVCRVVGVVPEHRWRTPGVAEYKVELVALPVIAFRRVNELALVPPAETQFSEQHLGAASYAFVESASMASR